MDINSAKRKFSFRFVSVMKDFSVSEDFASVFFTVLNEFFGFRFKFTTYFNFSF